MRTKKRIRLKGRLRIYMQTSLYMGILLLIVDIGTYFLDVRAGFLLTCFLLFYFGMIILLMFYNRPIILNELISFATQYGQVQKTLLRDMAIPYALLDETGRVIWCNDAFRAAIHSEKGFHKSITYVFPAITRERLPQGEQEAEIEISFEESDYIAHITRVSLRGMISEDSDVLDDEDYDSCLYAMYLYDETALKLALRENDAQSLAVGLIYLDNYEEALASVEEVRRSLLKALIDRKVNKYISSFDGICQNIEKDKYLVILKKKSVMQMQEQRFELLEDVKTVNIGNEMAVTLSIGIGLDGLVYAQNYEFARTAIDFALGRGGDQAVIKNKFNFAFFGGLSEEVEKRTKVKSRVVANALSQLIRDSSQVLVMGHKNSDMDAIGAAAGMVCAARVKGRPVHIVVDRQHTMASDLIERLETQSEYKGVFISAEDAMIACDFNTLLIVVDVNRPGYVESAALLESINKIAVIDHPRRAADYIENAVVSLHEPYASSASELVSELLQYLVPTSGILTCEAEAMLAGIYLDTKGFSTRTGVRTFEAAAYLRRAGAESSDVKRLFQSSFDQYMERQKLISSARDCGQGVIFAITGEEVDRIAAAQAADELLSIIGTHASVVAFRSGNDMAVSARAAGHVNVQLLMERLGGGGNHSAAGAQLKNTTPEEADKLITDAIRGYFDDQRTEKQDDNK